MEDSYESLRARFGSAGQGHVFDFWDELGERSRRRLLRALARIDLVGLSDLREALSAERSSRRPAPAPVFALANPAFPYALADEARAVSPLGEKALRDGQVAVLLVAGGQGTRLGFDGPKGCYPILPLSGMTLFEVFARKLLRVSREQGRTPPLYVMVGRHNEHQTRNFWQDHNYFGLAEDDVRFFVQGELPALDDDGRLIMAAPDEPFTAPDGHGGVIGALAATGMIDDMRRRGIRIISYLQVDNMRAPVADPSFLGLHLAEGAEMSLKVVRKTDPDEKVGIYCLDDGVPSVVEYTEFSEAQAVEREGENLRWWAGSIAVHAFSVDFLARLARGGVGLPLHAARKKVPRANAQDEVEAWKFERFVFDALPLASKVACLEVPREEQFLPLKNADGPFGPDGVRDACRDYWRRAVETALGKRPSEIEVDPMLCENAHELIELLKASSMSASLSFDEPLRLSPDTFEPFLGAF